MNDLSKLIYFADVAGSIGALGTVLGVLSVAGAAASVMVSTNIAGSVPEDPLRYEGPAGENQPLLRAKQDLKRKEYARKYAVYDAWLSGGFRWARRCGYALAACVLTVVVVPSSDTVYAIAASEMGERVLSSPTAGKALKALDHWLDRQIDDEPQAGSN